MKRLLILLIIGSVSLTGFGQEKFTEDILKGLKLRSIGPAFTSGRIADIAIHPEDESTWYVAVGSGGVWKTVNNGATWSTIFDDQPVYSTGCITIDPNNPHTIWLGTGENVGGRHVGFGDGIYKSEDDGKTWKNMGLASSERISKIIVHPENSSVLWVAVQGPLWTKGGERGLYKSTDGGKSWKKTLGGNEWTGVTDVVIDPSNPDWLYAATWQRHRTVAAYMGGGPGSGLHRSTDGGETWEQLKDGIPKSNLGKIGLAISPFNPDVLYAAIEMDLREGGVFMSTNRGKTWKKQSDAVSGGTGPHYYQELYASPHHQGRLYMANNSMLVSDDHGKTFRYLKREGVHSDSHAIAFRESDPDYILLGTDGGLYETYDLAENWTYIDNMPITQYYKVAVDDSEPFYKVYGGTQDNGSHGGPSRTPYSTGIRNRDWWKTLGADGHQSATEPGNPNITYAETQHGGLYRIDQLTGEQVYIAPQPKEGEAEERYNWDSPILVSPHNPTTIYYASQRVWKSENRGDAWTAISGDLTRNEERITLPIMGGLQSYDNAWDLYAMSFYSTITSLSESPVQEGLIYAGTDDGIIQVTEDGQNWRKTEVGSIKGIPARAFVNDIRADLYDANVVYAALDNHKYGDFKPYLLKSTDKGRSWTLMSGDLPDKHLTWRLVQDHVDQNLLFAATEFGIFVTKNGGTNWVKLKGGVPTISFRDLTIQRRENDLVAASFGRSFYILDDITPLREVTQSDLAAEAKLFSVKDANWYTEREAVGSQGSVYAADNPPYGAVFTYYLKDELKSKKDLRKEREKKLAKNNQDIPFPGWEALASEARQEEPMIVFTIRDSAGNLVNTIEGKNKKGMQRVSWDLSTSDKGVIELDDDEEWGGSSFSATPGTYTVAMHKMVDGTMTQLDEPREFDVVPLWKETALPGASHESIASFNAEMKEYQQQLGITSLTIETNLKKADAMKVALARTDKPSEDLFKAIHTAKMKLLSLQAEMNGNEAMNSIGAWETRQISPRARYGVARRSSGTTYGPTATQRESLTIGKKKLETIKGEVMKTLEEMTQLESSLKAVGAPYIEGQVISTNE